MEVLIGNQVVKIHPSSVVAPIPHPAIIFDELVRTLYYKCLINPHLTYVPGFHNSNLCTRGFGCD